MAARLMNPDSRVALSNELNEEYNRLREENAVKHQETVPLEKARENRLKLF